MMVLIPVVVSIAMDDDRPNPTPGSAEEKEMIKAAEDAVLEAIIFTENERGYQHTMKEIASVGLVSTSDKASRFRG